MSNIKHWIINILQYIINSIESEEDKTLPEDYFKDVIIELQQLPKREMTEEEMQKVWNQIHSLPGFSCGKQVLKINTCKNCPIYCQSFNPD